MSTANMARTIPRGSRRVASVAMKRSISCTTVNKAMTRITAVVPAKNIGWQNSRPPTNSTNEADRNKLLSRKSSALPNFNAFREDEEEDEIIVVSSAEGHDTIKVKMEDLRERASRRTTPLRLADMYKYAVNGDAAQRLRNAQFIHNELPIRAAQRAFDLLTFPHGLNESEHIRAVAHVYLRYVQQLGESPLPETQTQERQFTDLLKSMVLDRTTIPILISKGIEEWREQRGRDSPKDLEDIEDGLYRFFLARVGLRFLTEHHVLSSPHHTSHTEVRHDRFGDNNFLGCIQTECNPKVEVQRVAKEVIRQTKNHYGLCPEIEIVDCSPPESDTFTYVPHHLQYMIAELLKNSCRATVRRYLGHDGKGGTDELYPIRVVIVNGAENVSIKIADRGGGVPRSTMEQIWKFAHSTADTEEEWTEFGTDEITGSRIRGFGLPLARVYAKYFGGALTLKSMEGYGLDAYLYLPRLGDACENLPSAVLHSPGERDSTPWC